jgi:hypothetical protein
MTGKLVLALLALAAGIAALVLVLSLLNATLG